MAVGRSPPSGGDARLPPAPNGRLVATVLSAYDCPSDLQPTSVSLTILGTTVSTGPPSARHRDRNSFKFADPPQSGGRDALLSGESNELVVSADLAALYPATAELQDLWQHRQVQEQRKVREVRNGAPTYRTWYCQTLGGLWSTRYSSP